MGGEEIEGKDDVLGERDMVVFGLPSDSGIGTDLPTVDLEAREGYFRGKEGL